MPGPSASRRDFLTAGALASLAPPATAVTPRPQATSVVWLWLGGGPSQLDTFDPKPDAPVEVRGPAGVVKTPLPGVVFADRFPELAKRMARLAVVRSFAPGTTDHTAGSHRMMTGADQPDDRPALGAVLARHRGPTTAGGLPTYVRMGHIRGDGPGRLGPAFAPQDWPAPDRLGEQLRTARRLCAAGVGYVTIHHGGWDSHGEIGREMAHLGPRLDAAVAAFLDDLADRGMTDEVLLVVTGEFGRTPRLNRSAGRDHWAPLGPLLLAGGGLRTGQVIGTSSARGEEPISPPVRPADLRATVAHALGLPADGRVIRELV